MFTKATRFALSLIISLVFALPLQAAEAEVIRINPETLRQRLLESNTSVLVSLNQVQQSKQQINLARGNLLPSLNVGTAMAGGSGFVLSTVSFLLPFLLPSNWANLDASKKQLTADGISFYLVQLNTYASAMALYSTLLSDQELRATYQYQADNLIKIQKLIEQLLVSGIATKADLEQATAHAELAQLQVAQVDELLAQEKASLRHLLALPLETEIEFDVVHRKESQSELSSAQEIFAQISQNSPEERQMASLIQVSKDNVWSKSFGFMTSNSLSFQSKKGGSVPPEVAFNSVQENASFNLGFALVPQIRLSQLNVAQLKIRLQEVRQEEVNIIESTLSSISSAKSQLTLASSAEQHLKNVYEIELLRFKFGMTDLLHLLDVANNITTAAVGRIKSQADLDRQRVSLQRILISDEFAMIKECQWDSRRSGRGKASLDQLCGHRVDSVASETAKDDTKKTIPTRTIRMGRP